MPPRIRTRGAKALKENPDIENKLKQPGKFVKTNRKVLGDKTNSLSDDNEEVNEVIKVPIKLSPAVENKVRPRRQRRLPTRFKENPVLNNLSTSQNKSTSQTRDKSPEITIQFNNNENNLKCIENSQSQVKQGRKVIPKRGKKVTNQVANTIETKVKVASGIKEAFNIQNYSQSQGRPATKKSVDSFKSKVSPSRKKQIASGIGKRESPKKIPLATNKNTIAENVNASNITDKIVDISKNSDRLNASQTFTPPSKRKPIVALESIVKKRPKRIHRLPSRFDDHSTSPNKFIPLQPCHASTPLQKKNSPSNKRIQKHSLSIINIDKSKDESKLDKNNSSNKTSPDTNNNPKRVRSARLKVKPKTAPVTSPKNIKTGKRILDKSLSFKILDDNKKSKKSCEKLDVYEFTFDPAEEPPPQKKKKRRVVKKKPSKPKTVVFNNNYDKNVSKALAALKTVVSKNAPPKGVSNKKPQQVPHKDAKQIETNPTPGQKENKREVINEVVNKPAVQKVQHSLQAKPQNLNDVSKPPQPLSTNQITPANPNVQTNTNNSVANNIGNKSVHENPPSIRVEDIEADFDLSYHDDINYSPLNSPRALTPNPTSVTQNYNEDNRCETIERAIHNKDPLNLQGDSFFDDQPVASSSMNVSIRHPLASPWRVEFGSLPIKWQANTYMKANMTPAVESSFISSEDNNKKKHVYVNMIPQTNDSLPHIVENTPNLKQTSIISFIKEVAERNAKKKRGKPSPMKANTLFEDITNKTNVVVVQKASKNVTSKPLSDTSNEYNSNSSSNTSNDKENVRLTRKRKNENVVTKLPAKSPRKEKDNDVTYFGFDDSENQDQENAIPRKKIDKNKVRSLRSRARVLQEVNGQNRPARAALPLAAKTKIASSSEAVQRMYDEMKSAEDAPQFLDKNAQQNAGTTNIDPAQNVSDNEEEESFHLFEDINVVHHLKPTRKSYGKAKKVTFRHRSNSDSETHASDVRNHSVSSYEDDLADLTFTMPEINQKKTVTKKKSKKVMSKKEEKEANEWAAGFNSMCEDIEEFPLLVE